MTTGFLYVATGERYIKEAIQSATSLRRSIPTARICLISDQRVDSTLFDEQLMHSRPLYRLSDKIEMIRSPYDRTVFLDTDTIISDDISDLFMLLDTHDIAFKHDNFPGLYYTLPGVPNCFIEANTGLIAFRKSDRVELFFRQWQLNYDERLTEQQLTNDQASFRQTLYSSGLRYCVLPIEYHFQTEMGAFVFWKIKMFHGRDHRNLSLAMSDVNYRLGARVWIPGVAVIPSQYSGLKNQLATWAMVNWKFFLASLRAVLDKLRFGRTSRRGAIAIKMGITGKQP
jgi:hypothetical protein